MFLAIIAQAIGQAAGSVFAQEELKRDPNWKPPVVKTTWRDRALDVLCFGFMLLPAVTFGLGIVAISFLVGMLFWD